MGFYRNVDGGNFELETLTVTYSALLYVRLLKIKLLGFTKAYKETGLLPRGHWYESLD